MSERDPQKGPAPTKPDPTEGDGEGDEERDQVEEGSEESFPASDPPAW